MYVGNKKVVVRSGIRTHAHRCGPECSGKIALESGALDRSAILTMLHNSFRKHFWRFINRGGCISSLLRAVLLRWCSFYFDYHFLHIRWTYFWLLWMICLFTEGMSMTHMASARSTSLDGVLCLSWPRREVCERAPCTCSSYGHGQTRLLFQSSNTRFWTKYIKTSFAGPRGLKRLSLSSRRTFSEAPKPLWLGLTSSHRWIPSTASVFIPSVNSSKYHNSTYLLSIHPIVTIELSSTNKYARHMSKSVVRDHP